MITLFVTVVPLLSIITAHASSQASRSPMSTGGMALTIGSGFHRLIPIDQPLGNLKRTWYMRRGSVC